RRQQSGGIVERRLPQRPEANGAAAIGGGILNFKALRNRGEFLLRLLQSHSGLQARVSFDPARAAVFEFVAAGLEDILHRNRHPEVHAPADEGAVKALGRNADNGVHDTVEALCFADNLAVAMEPVLPKLRADHGDWMRALALIFSWQEAAAEDGVYSDGVKIIRRYDAAGGALGAIADAERGTANLADEGGFAKRAAA